MNIRDIRMKLIELEKKYPKHIARIDIELLEPNKKDYKYYDFGYDEFNVFLEDCVNIRSFKNRGAE